MNNVIRAIAAAASLALLMPASVSAMTAPQTYTLQTRLYDRDNAGEIDGKLRLRIARDGIVQGTYLTDQGEFISVTGGRDGKTIWLDFGLHGRLHMEGTFENGKLVLGSAIGFDVWTLEGTAA